MKEIIDPKVAGPEEEKVEAILRPRTFSEFIGQKYVVSNLRVFVEAAKRRGETLDHVLLHGPAGLGKTTLAFIIARELNANIKVSSGPAIERPGDLASILTSLEEGDVLFIDEIHRLHPAVEEVLYPALEDFCLDIVIGKGSAAKSLRINLPRFTLIAATTRFARITAPLRGRFGIIERLDYYPEDELMAILRRSARILKVELEEEANREIARRARGTPRIANRLLRRVRDFADIEGEGKITKEIALLALERLRIDSLGLDDTERKIIEVLVEQFAGGPVGLKTLAAAVKEEVDTIEEIHEPYLLEKGLLARTARGRIATEKAFQYLGKHSGQGKLF